jgi:hypothetical protein
VGFKGVEGIDLEHRSSSHIQEASKKNVNTCENDAVKLNVLTSCSFPFNNFFGGVEGLGPAPSIWIKRPRGQPQKMTKTPSALISLLLTYPMTLNHVIGKDRGRWRGWGLFHRMFNPEDVNIMIFILRKDNIFFQDPS